MEPALQKSGVFYFSLNHGTALTGLTGLPKEITDFRCFSLIFSSIRAVRPVYTGLRAILAAVTL